MKFLICDVIKSERPKDSVSFIITHDIAEVNKISDCLIVLSGEKLCCED